MSLVTPSIGLIFWTSVVFTILVLILRKFAWNPILNSVNDRNKKIEEALKAAEDARLEMTSLSENNEKIMDEAKRERDMMLKEAREIKNKIVLDAKNIASEEAEKIIDAAKDQIENQKMKAATQLKNEVALLSIQMAEKILKKEFSDKEKQKNFVSEIINKKETK